MSKQYYNAKRNIYHLEFFYSSRNKMIKVHGRFSVGLFVMLGKARWYIDAQRTVNEDVVRHQYCGIEFTQEAIFGSPLLYVGVGVGAGYIFPCVSGEFSPAKLNLY